MCESACFFTALPANSVSLSFGGGGCQSDSWEMGGAERALPHTTPDPTRAPAEICTPKVRPCGRTGRCAGAGSLCSALPLQIPQGWAARGGKIRPCSTGPKEEAPRGWSKHFGRPLQKSLGLLWSCHLAPHPLATNRSSDKEGSFSEGILLREGCARRGGVRKEGPTFPRT